MAGINSELLEYHETVQSYWDNENKFSFIGYSNRGRPRFTTQYNRYHRVSMQKAIPLHLLLVTHYTDFALFLAISSTYHSDGSDYDLVQISGPSTFANSLQSAAIYQNREILATFFNI